MNLAQLQSALFSLVTDDGKTTTKAEEFVSGGSLTPDQRVHVYASMFVARTQDSIREDFPKVTKALGDSFVSTVGAYLQRFPSTHFSLSMLGHGFPGFLRDTQTSLLADLAELEWLHAHVFVAEDCEPLTSKSLAGLDPEKFAGGRLDFIPAFKLVWLAHDVRPLWRALEAGEEAVPEIEAERTAMLVWRKGHEVFHVALEADEARAIQALQQGETIGAACDAFAEREAPAVAAFTAIGSWFNEGMVARLNL